MGHWLKINEGNEMPTHILAFDTEAYVTENKHEFRLGSFVYLRRNKDRWIKKNGYFKSLKEWYNIIDEHLIDKGILYIIAHNMRYDYRLTNMDDYLVNKNFSMDEFVIGDSQFIISAIKNNQRITFIDTMNYFAHMKLEVLGHAFGLEKMEIENFKNVSDDELLPYCMNDSEIVALVIINFLDFIKKNDLGNFALTIAGQAFNALRHRFMDEKSILIHGHQNIYEMEMSSYHGGRTDIFKQGIFYNIYKKPVLNFFKKFEKNVCPKKKCKVFASCHGGCPAISLLVSGDLNAPDPRCNSAD